MTNLPIRPITSQEEVFQYMKDITEFTMREVYLEKEIERISNERSTIYLN